MTGPPRRPFTSAESAEAFDAAYDEVLAQWPIEVTPMDVHTDHGTTHVQICGPEDGPR